MNRHQIPVIGNLDTRALVTHTFERPRRAARMVSTDWTTRGAIDFRRKPSNCLIMTGHRTRQPASRSENRTGGIKGSVRSRFFRPGPSKWANRMQQAGREHRVVGPTSSRTNVLRNSVSEATHAISASRFAHPIPICSVPVRNRDLDGSFIPPVRLPAVTGWRFLPRHEGASAWLRKSIAPRVARPSIPAAPARRRFECGAPASPRSDFPDHGNLVTRFIYHCSVSADLQLEENCENSRRSEACRGRREIPHASTFAPDVSDVRNRVKPTTAPAYGGVGGNFLYRWSWD